MILNFFILKDSIIPPKLIKNIPNADMQLHKIHYTSTNEQGEKEWELDATTANYFKDKKLAEFHDVSIIFYSKKGKTFTLRGDTGSLNTETKDVYLSGNVVGTSSDGYQFRTETLTYKANKHRAKTDRKVVLEGPQFNLEGRGMVMDLEKEKVFLLKDVRAREKK